MSKLLVIEDDPRIQKALQRQFVAEGFNVFIAGDGREGLAAAKAQKPDAVILDLMLPGLSGREVCKGIRAIAPGIPVLILSPVSRWRCAARHARTGRKQPASVTSRQTLPAWRSARTAFLW